MKKRKILSLLLALILCLSLLPTAAFATDEHSHPVCGATCSCDDTHSAVTWVKWTETGSLPSASGNYYLVADVTLSAEWCPADGTTLCLAGHTVIGAKSEGVISIETGQTFTLTDCTGNGKIAHASNENGRGVYCSWGTFNLYGGNITENNIISNKSTGGSGVFVHNVNCHNANFVMYGGSITGNSTNLKGGGVFVVNDIYNSSIDACANFTMYGGNISGNSGDYGGGICVYANAGNAIFTMHGGNITGNKAQTDGAAVWVCGNESYTSDGQVNLYGGNIIGNSAENRGGGVFVSEAKTTLTVSGAAKVKENVKGGTLNSQTGKYTGGTANNVYLFDNNTITLSGALTGGAGSIGVTTETAPTTNVPVKFAVGKTKYSVVNTDKQAFTPDLGTSAYYVSLDSKNNELKLCSGTEPHEHEWKYRGRGTNGMEEYCANSDGKCDNTNGGVVTIVAPSENTVYDGTAKKATLSGSFASGAVPTLQYYLMDGNQGTLLTNGTFPTNAGNYKAQIRLGDGEGHVEYSIAKATPTVTGANAVVTYGTEVNGSDITATTNTVGSFQWQNVSSYGDAADTDKTFYATFTPNDTTNYHVVENVPVRVRVNKAAPKTLSNIPVSHKYNISGEQSKQIGDIMPASAGTLSYNTGTSSVVGTATVDSFSVSESGLVKYTITNGEAGAVITLPVKISSVNYKDSTVCVVVTLTDKDAQAPLSITSGTNVTYKQTLTLTSEGGSGNGAVRYEVITDSETTGSATIEGSTLTATGAGTIKIKAIKAADDDYASAESAIVTITVDKATPTGAPKYTAITTDGKTLADASLSTTDSSLNPNEGTLEWLDNNGNVLPDSTVVTRNTVYQWRFTPSDSNYTVLTGSAELYRILSSGGSSVSRYTVKFHTAGGNIIASQTIKKNGTATEPKTPKKNGYLFEGWYTDSKYTTEYDFATKVTKNITLYAKWAEEKAEDPSDDIKDDIKDENKGDEQKPTKPESKIAFTDVKDKDWFSENVKYVIENGLMNGTTDTEFAPNDNLTRAMLVTILYRAAGEPEGIKSIPFGDVTSNSYYRDAVIWAQQNGIVSGVSKTEFAPDENITREQIAAIIYRYAKAMGYDVSVGEDTNILSYTDFEEISEYAVEAMQYAVGSGLMKGKSETTLNPNDKATRAEIAAILQRFLEANAK